MLKNRSGRLIISLVAAIIALTAVFSYAQSDRPSRKELYKYLWDFIIVGEGDAVTEDLKNIASYYSSLPAPDRTKIEETLASPGISERQKRANMLSILPNVRYGTIATKDGQTYKGVIYCERSNGRGDFYDKPTMRIKLTKGGYGEVSWQKAVEISFGQEVVIRTNADKLIHGEIHECRFQVFRTDAEPLLIYDKEVKTIVFGQLKRAQCEDCFRKMEIDWNFCPYCGTKLKRKENLLENLKRQNTQN